MRVHSSYSQLKLRVQLVLALLLVLVLVLVLGMFVYRGLILAIRMLVPLLHASPALTTSMVGYPRPASPSASPSGRRQGQLHHAQARARTPEAVAYGRRRPVVNRSGEPMQPREQPHLYSEGKPPYVGDFHRPVDEAALLAYALQVFREPPPSGVSVLAESRRWTWWWAGRPLQVCN